MVSHVAHRAVLKRKHDGVEDDAGEDDGDDGDAPPLHSKDALRAAVHLAGTDPDRTRGANGAPSPVLGGIEDGDVDFNAVDEGGEGNDDGHADKDEERDPKDLHAVQVIADTGAAEAVRDAADNHDDGAGGGRDAPAGGKGPPHELA